MKTIKNLSFGFSAVNAGQRNVVVEPQLLAVSTEGGFRITPPISRVLGIGNGEYIMFVNNVDNIDNAILNKVPEIVEYCEANGLTLGSPEATIAIHKEFDVWGIAKGIAEYDSKGNMKTSTERLTKNDKIKFVSQHFDEMLAAAINDADDETKDALTREGVTKEEQMDILSAFVTPRELPKFKGSKVANPAGLSGTGVSLTFTDSNVWKQLKVDLGDEAEKLNRIYDVDIENLQDAVINDGFKNVNVKVLVLGDYVDKAPVRIGKGNEE